MRKVQILFFRSTNIFCFYDLVWVDECQVTEVRNAPFLSLMDNERVDIVNIEELSVYYRCTKIGLQLEHIMEILLLKKIDAQSIYSVLLEWQKKKELQYNKSVGMGFDEASTFAGKKSGVRAANGSYSDP